MWSRLASFTLIVTGGIAQAQSANEGLAGLEACFKAARVAGTNCSRLSDDPGQRMDCFTKAWAVQLDCMDRVPSEASAGPRPSEKSSDAARSTPPYDIAAPELLLEGSSSEEPAEGTTSKGPAPVVSVGSIPAGEPAEQPNAVQKSIPVSRLPSVAEAPSGPMRTDASGKKNDRVAGEPEWVLSETTSPVDFSPLVVAVIRSSSGESDGPNVLAVRCRSRHTEVSLQLDGTWVARGRNNLQVYYQINEQPIVRQQWTLSADRKTVTYKGDTVQLLQSIPEGAALKVAVVDQGASRHEATFRLTGLFNIRRKLAAACEYTRLIAKP